MTSQVMEYKGYVGSAEVDVDDGVLVGKLLYLRDTITYSAHTFPELRRAFEEAVDDYLSVCTEAGDDPDVPFKGTFNVRVGAERHRLAALAARARGIGMNDLLCDALDLYVKAGAALTVLHRHEHFVGRTDVEKSLIVSTGGEGTLEEASERNRH